MPDITKQETFIIPRYYIILDSSFEHENKKSYGRHYGQPPQYESFFCDTTKTNTRPITTDGYLVEDRRTKVHSNNPFLISRYHMDKKK